MTNRMLMQRLEKCKRIYTTFFERLTFRSVNEIFNKYFKYSHLPVCDFGDFEIRKKSEISNQSANYFRKQFFYYKTIISYRILPILILPAFNKCIFIKIRGDTAI